MKKIAGITWWKSNYGSILQAFALNKVINNMEIVDYEILQQFSVNSFSLKSLFAYIKKDGIIKTIHNIKKRFGNRKLRDRKSKCEEFILNNMNISEKEYNPTDLKTIENDYDGFICGSDQIWNPTFTNSSSSIYWLNFSNSKLKIAYAPSIGTTKIEEPLRNEIKEALKAFKAISCREQVGTNLINEILDDDICKTVVDPTLLLTRDDWDSLITEQIVKGEYVFSYILRGNDEQRQMVKRFAKERGLKLVTIPFLEADYCSKLDGKYADINFTNASPQEFINLIKYSKYVFTDSFHCMVFSCIYHRTFFSFNKKGKNQMLRINDFQKWFCIGNRVVNNLEDISSLLKVDMDPVWNKFEQRVNEERKKSMMFLNNALM